MKTLTLIFVVFGLCQAQAQKMKKDEVAFEAALKLFEEDKTYEGIDALNDFIKNYPLSKLRPWAHFDIGVAYYSVGELKSAADVFLEILDMGYNEHGPNNLMEPYALYKHNSARYLADISLLVKEWDDAERYIIMFDKEFPYQHFCGNEWAAYDLMKATMLARLHEGQGRIDEAVRDLAPHIFPNGLASNEEVVSLLKEILQRNYSEREILTELESSLNTIRVVTKRKTSKTVFTLFGAEVDITGGYFLSEEKYPEPMEVIKSSPLFVAFLGK